MRRRTFLKGASGFAAGSLIAWCESSRAQSTDSQPNILWLTCEDISPHLGCYGGPEARTPNLDKFATEGARYTNAFSVSGVCAPSRSCLITSMYPMTLGTGHMRCSHRPPDHVKCFPEYLRNAGYYCTNNRKTDYNFGVPKGAWDECSGKAHYRQRPNKNQPFFAVFNFTATHESKVGRLLGDSEEELKKLPLEERHDPAKATLPPYYPDTPLIRKHWAHYYDLITIMDRWAGDHLKQLEEDGLADNTIVIYFSDHGVGLPRAKRWLYDSGLHVPFMVRWPGHIEPGTVRDNLISFVDFGATVLSLAGVPVPDHMQGRPFLGGQKAAPREYIHGARDRMDERYDLIRIVRDKRYKYIRNYEPFRPYDQHIQYLESWPVMIDMRRVQAAGELKGSETLFFRQTKPLEELYDTQEDPHEVRNLAEDPEHQATLDRLRKVMDAWLQDTRDLGFVPEMELDAWLESGGKAASPGNAPGYGIAAGDAADGQVFGRPLNEYVEELSAEDRLARLRAMTTLGLAGPVAIPILTKGLADTDCIVAYWAARRLGDMGQANAAVVDALSANLKRSEVSARLAAAGALCRLGQRSEAIDVVLECAKDKNQYVRLFAVQILEMLEPKDDRTVAVLTEATKDKLGYVGWVAKHALSIE